MGLVPKSAIALAEAGYCSLFDLAEVTEEMLLAIPAVGPAAVPLLEAALGRPIPSSRKRRSVPLETRLFPELVWRKRGLSTSAAITFAIAGMTLESLRSISREELLAMPGVGVGAIKACELMIGHTLPSSRRPT